MKNSYKEWSKCIGDQKDLNASQSIETKEDLFFGILSRKQPLDSSAYERCHDKIYIILQVVFSFAPLVLF